MHEHNLPETMAMTTILAIFQLDYARPDRESELYKFSCADLLHVTVWLNWECEVRKSREGKDGEHRKEGSCEEASGAAPGRTVSWQETALLSLQRKPRMRYISRRENFQHR